MLIFLIPVLLTYSLEGLNGVERINSEVTDGNLTEIIQPTAKLHLMKKRFLNERKSTNCDEDKLDANILEYDTYGERIAEKNKQTEKNTRGKRQVNKKYLYLESDSQGVNLSVSPIGSEGMFACLIEKVVQPCEYFGDLALQLCVDDKPGGAVIDCSEASTSFCIEPSCDINHLIQCADSDRNVCFEEDKGLHYCNQEVSFAADTFFRAVRCRLLDPVVHLLKRRSAEETKSKTVQCKNCVVDVAIFVDGSKEPNITVSKRNMTLRMF